jgi:hypothetical protein
MFSKAAILLNQQVDKTFRSFVIKLRQQRGRASCTELHTNVQISDLPLFDVCLSAGPPETDHFLSADDKSE